MKTNTTTTTTTTPAISFKRIFKSNERCLIYDLRQSLVKGDKVTALTLIKSWLALQGEKDSVPNDRDVVAMFDNLMKVFFTGKNATVAGKKDAELVAMSQGKLKAWMYTFKRGDVAIIDNFADKVRPEEKQGKARKAKTYKVDAVDFEAYKAWKEAMEKVAK